jgi:hypothetical protein
MLSLRVFADIEEIISQAVEALAQLVLGLTEPSLRSTIGWEIGNVLITSLLDFSGREEFAFLDFPPNRRSRVRFYELISRLIWLDSGHRQLLDFQKALDQRISEIAVHPTESLVQGMLLDLRGLFLGATGRFAYASLFSWFYPRTVDVLQTTTVVFSACLPYYLKFLLELVSNTGSRIVFERHSADGLRLFKTTANSLLSFYRSIPRFIDSNAGILKNPKCFVYSMRIMEVILTNPHSNLGALEVYKDTTLTDLIREFLLVVSKINLARCLTLRKLTRALMQLLACLFGTFTDKIMAVDPNFLVVGLELSASLHFDCQDVDGYFEYIFKIISSLTWYSIKHGDENFHESIRPSYEKILKMLEEVVLRCDEGAYFQVTSLISTVLLMKPRNWPDVRQKLRLFLQFCVDKEMKEAIDDLTTRGEEI